MVKSSSELLIMRVLLTTAVNGFTPVYCGAPTGDLRSLAFYTTRSFAVHPFIIAWRPCDCVCL